MNGTLATFKICRAALTSFGHEKKNITVVNGELKRTVLHLPFFCILCIGLACIYWILKYT